MSNRTAIALLITMMVNAVIFGTGAVTVLSVPDLAERAAWLLPAVIAASFIIAPVIAWYIAPKMRARYLRMQALRERKVALTKTRHGPS